MPMRLLIVSNRLPVTVLDEQTLKLQESVGGLSSGLETPSILPKQHKISITYG